MEIHITRKFWNSDTNTNNSGTFSQILIFHMNKYLAHLEKSEQWKIGFLSMIGHLYYLTIAEKDESATNLPGNN